VLREGIKPGCFVPQSTSCRCECRSGPGIIQPGGHGWEAHRRVCQREDNVTAESLLLRGLPGAVTHERPISLSLVNADRWSAQAWPRKPPSPTRQAQSIQDGD